MIKKTAEEKKKKNRGLNQFRLKGLGIQNMLSKDILGSFWHMARQTSISTYGRVKVNGK